MNFINENNERRTFSRAVLASSTSDFRVDNEQVSPADYHLKLQEIRIFIKARNFLVYQARSSLNTNVFSSQLQPDDRHLAGCC